MRPSPAVVLLRGLVKRCPRCGAKRIVRRWWIVPKRCPACGFALQRDENAFLGSITINYALTGLVFILVLVVWVARDLPDIRVLPMMVSCVLVSGLVPVVFYPHAKTLWAAIDLLYHPEDWTLSPPSEPTPSSPE